MSRRLAAVLSCLGVLAVADRAAGAEPIEAAVPSAAELQAYQFAYVEFPQRLQAVNDAVALAELNVAYWRERVEGYRPFRSFDRYAAAYSADRLAQLQLLAAQQELACLLRDKGDLWRERQAVAQAALYGQARYGQKSQPR